MDVLFNPSVTETFGNVTLEAMAAGVPVVAADATGSRSLVESGVTGELVRPGAIHFFADALAHYVQNDEARRAAGHAGRLASRAYEWDKVNQALVDSYLRIERQRAGGVAGTPPLQRVPWPGSRRP
jgi:glycosyltransferase involved in cell wall biosynthesis